MSTARDVTQEAPGVLARWPEARVVIVLVVGEETTGVSVATGPMGIDPGSIDMVEGTICKVAEVVGAKLRAALSPVS
jgi:hypothetical protein